MRRLLRALLIFLVRLKAFQKMNGIGSETKASIEAFLDSISGIDEFAFLENERVVEINILLNMACVAERQKLSSREIDGSSPERGHSSDIEVRSDIQTDLLVRALKPFAESMDSFWKTYTHTLSSQMVLLPLLRTAYQLQELGREKKLCELFIKELKKAISSDNPNEIIACTRRVALFANTAYQLKIIQLQESKRKRRWWQTENYLPLKAAALSA